MKRILVAKDLAYANDKAAAGANSAVNPLNLMEGAIGVYGIPKTSNNNKDKLALIIDGGSDAAGKVPDSAFDGKSFMIALGLANGSRESVHIDIGNLQDVEVSAGAYDPAVAQVTEIGKGSVAGSSANMPTAVTGDTVGVKISKSEDQTVVYVQGQQYEQRLTAGESDYSAVSKLAAKIADDEDALANVKVKTDLTGSAFANSATVTAVNGETSLTTSANHGVGVGDYLSLGGDVYQAVTGTATTTLVLDRPYGGASATIANNATLDLGATDPTEVGLEITGKVAGQDLIIAAYGNLDNADHNIATPATQGEGTYEIITALENLWEGNLGTARKLDASVPRPGNLAVAGGTYDVYRFVFKNSEMPAGNNQVTDVINELVVAFPDGNSNGGQGEFEDIVGTLLNGADGLGGID